MTHFTKKIITFFFTTNIVAHATNYYVSNAGNNDNSGTSLTSPLASIQHAVKQMQPGDTCFIKGGTYHETINLSGIAGTKGKPITITSFNNEEVILDGTISINTNWKLDKGNIYKTTIPQDITQLFVDNQIMTLARFPNLKTFSDEIWHRTKSRCQKSRESTNGKVILGAIPDRDISKLGVSLNNCVALLNFGAHSTSARLVQNHKAGSSEFDYSPELLKYKTTTNLFFEGGLGNAERALLDSQEEWAYDETDKTLYLWADNGENPNGRNIKGKVQTYAITGDASTKYITIDGLHFHATTFSFHHSDHITIQNCRSDYYACSKRSLGIGGFSDTAEFIGSLEDYCSHITIYNSTFCHSDASALKGDYVENMTIDNNLFYKIDYACVNNDLGPRQPFQPCSSIRLNKVQDLLYRRNTLHTSGNAQGFSANRYVKNPTKAYRPNQYKMEEIRPITCEYNFHTKCGLLHTDGASLYIPESHIMESVARFNWFIGNGQRDFRWDGNNKPLNGVHANLYRNVAFGTSIKKMSPSGGNGFRVKGSYHEVYNNLGIGPGGELNIATEKGKNEHTITRNNAATKLTDYPIPGDASHNFNQGKKGTSLKAILRDSNNWDFRPRANASELIDKGIPVTCSIKDKTIDVTKGFIGNAPDLGAYEYGDKTYWIPGRQETHAAMPIPRLNNTNTKLDTDLIYLNALGGIKTDIYLGTSLDSLKLIGKLKHPQNVFKIPAAQALKPSTTYLWRVDTYLDDGTIIKGELWSFTTESIQVPVPAKKPKKKKKK